MSKDWQIGSNFVKEPKITKVSMSSNNKDGYRLKLKTIDTHRIFMNQQRSNR